MLNRARPASIHDGDDLAIVLWIGLSLKRKLEVSFAVYVTMRNAVFLVLMLVAFPVPALTLSMPDDGDALVGDVFSILSRNEYTLAEIGRAYGLGFREIVAANPSVNPWVPGDGTEIVLPVSFLLPESDRHGVVLNLAELRMYYYLDDGKTVLSYPIGIGREGWRTPRMNARVVAVVANPSWMPTESILAEHEAMGDPLPRVVPPGPDNPLGKYAVQLDVPGYFLHGTNKALGVGMRVSHGCVRLFPEDIEEFARRVRKGTRLTVVDQPIKTGWHRGSLYLEIHEPLEEERGEWDPVAKARDAVHRAAAGRDVRINDEKLVEVALAAQGIPAKVSLD